MHFYLSTACQHEKCSECRLECKYCGARCMCPHHKAHVTAKLQDYPDIPTEAMEIIPDPFPDYPQDQL